MTEMLDSAVLLLGGTGSRIERLTRGVNKHLLPVYDRTLAENSLSVLIEIGCTRISVVTTPADQEIYLRVLKEAVAPEIELKFVVQPEPSGTADAIYLGTQGLASSQSIVLFGDNVFVGGVPGEYSRPVKPNSNLRGLLSWKDADLSELAVVDFTADGPSLRKKPHSLRAGYALTGFFVISIEPFTHFISDSVLAIRENGEVDILNFVDYSLLNGRCEFEVIEGEWHDTGHSYEALWRAGEAVRRSVI